MHIKSVQRFRPFSHLPGTKCYIPGSIFSCQPFPTLLNLHYLSEETPQLYAHLMFSLRGPVKQFTVQQDLEKGGVSVWGHAKEGYFRYQIHPVGEGSGLQITLEKMPRDVSFLCACQGEGRIHIPGGMAVQEIRGKVTPGQTFTLTHASLSGGGMKPLSVGSNERLTLGVDKKQEIQLLSSRCDLREILPLWFRVGEKIPHFEDLPQNGSFALLQTCEKHFINREWPLLFEKLQAAFMAGFEGLFSPTLHDPLFQGLTGSEAPKGSPLGLLSGGRILIRRCFLEDRKEALYVLTSLPPQFPCGRLTKAQCQSGVIDIEWRGKGVRRVVFHAEVTAQLRFHFKREVKAFRLTTGGIRQTVSAETPLEVKEGTSYFFDHFQT